MLSLGKKDVHNLPFKPVTSVYHGMPVQLGPYEYRVNEGIKILPQQNWFLYCPGQGNQIVFDMLGHNTPNKKYDYLASIGVKVLSKGNFPYLETEDMIKCINCLLRDCYYHTQKTKEQ